MFNDAKERARRRHEAALSPVLAAWRESDGSWFDGSAESVDRRIARCRVLQSGLRGAAGALAGTGRELDYIAAERDLAADRAALEGLRCDLLTGAADREHVADLSGFNGSQPDPQTQPAGGNQSFSDPSGNQSFSDSGAGAPDTGMTGTGGDGYTPPFGSGGDGIAIQKFVARHRHWVDAQAREFLREQARNADRAELAERARRHAAAETSAMPTREARALSAAFVARVAELAPRPRRAANRPQLSRDFPDQMLFG